MSAAVSRILLRSVNILHIEVCGSEMNAELWISVILMHLFQRQVDFDHLVCQFQRSSEKYRETRPYPWAQGRSFSPGTHLPMAIAVRKNCASKEWKSSRYWVVCDLRTVELKLTLCIGVELCVWTYLVASKPVWTLHLVPEQRTWPLTRGLWKVIWKSRGLQKVIWKSQWPAILSLVPTTCAIMASVGISLLRRVEANNQQWGKYIHQGTESSSSGSPAVHQHTAFHLFSSSVYQWAACAALTLATGTSSVSYPGTWRRQGKVSVACLRLR